MARRPPRGGAPAARRTGKASSRKERRKQERAAKKQRKVQYRSKRGQEVLKDQKAVKTLNKPPETGQSSSQNSSKSPREGDASASTGKKRPGLVSPKKKALLSGNERDEKEIAQLEKLLKVGKKKGHLPKSFQEDGLDCIFGLFKLFYLCVCVCVLSPLTQDVVRPPGLDREGQQ